MARNKVRLDHSGLGRILESTDMHRVIQDRAEEVVANVKAMNITVGDKDGGAHEIELPVEFSMTTTDRAHATVKLAHPAGEAVQAKHGALTKAAAEAGLEFRSRS